MISISRKHEDLPVSFAPVSTVISGETSNVIDEEKGPNWFTINFLNIIFRSRNFIIEMCLIVTLYY